MSHLRPGLGEIKFINWAYSFLATKVMVSSRDLIAIAKSSGEELKEKISKAGDYSFIELENIHGSIDKVIQFLQHPPFNQEIYKVIQAVESNFERRVGLTLIRSVNNTINSVRTFISTLSDIAELDTRLAELVQLNDNIDFIAVTDAAGQVIFHSSDEYRGTTIPALSLLPPEPMRSRYRFRTPRKPERPAVEPGAGVATASGLRKTSTREPVLSMRSRADCCSSLPPFRVTSSNSAKASRVISSSG